MEVKMKKVRKCGKFSEDGKVWFLKPEVEVKNIGNYLLSVLRFQNGNGLLQSYLLEEK